MAGAWCSGVLGAWEFCESTKTSRNELTQMTSITKGCDSSRCTAQQRKCLPRFQTLQASFATDLFAGLGKASFMHVHWPGSQLSRTCSLTRGRLRTYKTMLDPKRASSLGSVTAALDSIVALRLSKFDESLSVCYRESRVELFSLCTHHTRH